MIDSIGHTSDGNVWMRFKFEVQGIEQVGTLEMGQSAAQWVIDSMETALSRAKEIENVRDGTNIN